MAFEAKQYTCAYSHSVWQAADRTRWPTEAEADAHDAEILVERKAREDAEAARERRIAVEIPKRIARVRALVATSDWTEPISLATQLADDAELLLTVLAEERNVDLG
jgi:hypothetical protein